MSDEWQKDRETCERATEIARAVLRAFNGGCAGFDDMTKGPGRIAAVDAARTLVWVESIKRAAALSRIAALEAERDAAFKRGWEDAKKAAVEAVRTKVRQADDGCCLSMTRGMVETLDPDEALDAIRAVKMGEGKP